MYTLITGGEEAQEFEVSHAVASMSKLVSTMMNDPKDEEEQQPIPLPNITSDKLVKILTYCHLYQQEAMRELKRPLENEDLSQLVQEPFVTFINQFKNDAELGHFTEAVNYMDIPPLQDLCSAKITSYIKNKTPEQIRKNLGIVVKLSNEEEKKVEEEVEMIKAAVVKK